MTKRVMALTPDLVALSHRSEIDYGGGMAGTPLEDADFTQLATDIHQQNSAGPLWVFAYGSLIWKPDFVAVETRRATAFGWHRSFCLELKNWRGTPDVPGLMMALERGGRCDGMAYRLADQDPVPQIERMLRREISAHENRDMVRWINLRTGEGDLRALVFWAGPRAPRAITGLSPQEIAAVLARACGFLGSGAEYLHNTVRHLEEIGIHDRNLWNLQALVAEELRGLHALPQC